MIEAYMLWQRRSWLLFRSQHAPSEKIQALGQVVRNLIKQEDIIIAYFLCICRNPQAGSPPSTGECCVLVFDACHVANCAHHMGLRL